MSSDNHLLFRSLGVLFLALGIIAIIHAINLGDYEIILWGCYIGLILLGIGFLKRDFTLVRAELNILTIPLIIWAIDFFYLITTKSSLWGITDYFFIDSFSPTSKAISLQHLITLPLAFLGLYYLRPKKDKALIISLIQITALFIASRIFTSIDSNTNWVYYSNVFGTSGVFHIVLWFVGFFLMLFITDFFVRKFYRIK